MRNNPNGGGRKSSIWNGVKNKLSSLSSQWRSLSVEQRQSWADAVVNYPAVNKFGEPRVRSGYELFMHLNGNLLNIGLPSIVSPFVPEAFPETSQITGYVPAFEALLPTRAATPVKNDGAPLCFYSPSFFSAADFTLTQLYHAVFNMNSALMPKRQFNTMYQLFDAKLNTSDRFGVFVSFDDMNTATLHVRVIQVDIAATNLVLSWSGSFPLDQLSDNFSASIFYTAGASPLTYAYINGIPVLLSSNGNNESVEQFYSLPFIDGEIVGFTPELPTDVSGSMALGDPSFTTTNYFAVSNFRYFSDVYTAGLASVDGTGYAVPAFEWSEEAAGFWLLRPISAGASDIQFSNIPLVVELLRRGFILGSELARVPFDRQYEGKFINTAVLELDDNHNFVAIGEPYDDTTEWIVYIWCDDPWADDPNWPIIETPSFLNPKYSFVVSATPSTGSGVNPLHLKNRRLFHAVPIDPWIDASNPYAARYGVPSSDSVTTYYADLVNNTTGQKTSVKIDFSWFEFTLSGVTPSPNSVSQRFKAGSELSGKVN
jgi:hypothetical protein